MASKEREEADYEEKGVISGAENDQKKNWTKRKRQKQGKDKTKSVKR